MYQVRVSRIESVNININKRLYRTLKKVETIYRKEAIYKLFHENKMFKKFFNVIFIFNEKYVIS